MRVLFRRIKVTLLGAGAVLTAALVVLLGLVVPALPAAGSSGDVALDGTVRADAVAVPGAVVGFWTAAGARLAGTRTAADGRFSLRLPPGATGFLAVGSAPAAPKAVFTAGTDHLVRAVIGEGSAVPIAALTKPATARSIAARGTLQIRLQRAGRLTGTSAKFAGTGDDRGEVHLLRDDDGVVEVASAAPDGRITTGWVVPGTYGLQLFPQPPFLRRTLARVVVRPGATTEVAIDDVVRGATLAGTVTVAGRAATERIPAEVLRGTTLVDELTTDEQGRYSLPALAAGDYRIRFGATVIAPDGDYEGSPPPPTAATALPRTVRLTVADDLHDRTLDVDLRAAGSVSGRLTGAPGAGLLLESAAGRVLRVADADQDRGLVVGGLVPGRTYRIVATGSLHHGADPRDMRYGARTFTAGAATTSIGELAVTRRAPRISGRVAGATGGRVTAELAGYTATRSATATIAADGSYTIQTSTPGTWRVSADVTGRLPGPARTVALAGRGAHRDLRAGAVPASFRTRFDAGTVGVQVDGAAVSTTGARFDVQDEGGRGVAAATDLAAGSYRFADFGATVPATDGPWWFDPPTTPFVLRAGQRTDLGRVPLRLAGR